MVEDNRILENLFDFEEKLKFEIESYRIDHLQKGEIIIKQDTFVKSLPLLVEGNLRVFRHTEDREILFYYIQKGETCGMTLAACLERKRINLEIVAAQQSEVLWIPQGKVSEWLMKYRSWNEFIIRTFTHRQMQMVESFDEIAFHKIDKRIKDYLYDLFKEKQNPVIAITHQELANELGTTRVVISRILKNLELEGTIQLLRGAIKVKKLNRGSQFAF